MSEATQISHENISFQGIESLHMDPRLSEVLKKINVYNELLRTEPVATSAMREIIEDIDSDWRELLGQPGIFSGRATFPDEFDEYGTPSHDFYDDQQVLFQGVIPIEKALPSSAVALGEEESFYELAVGFKRESINLQGDHVVLEGVAMPGEIASLEFSFTMSPERARWILQELQPDLIDDIDTALLNDAQEESERALRLRDLSFKRSGDEETDDLLIGALAVYTNSMLRFDIQNGYDFAFDGMVWVKDETGIFRNVLAESEGLACIPNIIWMETPDEGDLIIPHLEMRLSKPEVEDVSDLPHVRVPIACVDRLHSIRHMYYFGESSGA